jgi:hypothetical protein
VTERARAGEPVSLPEEEAALIFYLHKNPTDAAVSNSLLSCLLRQGKPVPAPVARMVLASLLDAGQPDLDAIDGVVRVLQAAGACVPWAAIRASTERWARSSGTAYGVVERYVGLLWAHGRPIDHEVAAPRPAGDASPGASRVASAGEAGGPRDAAADFADPSPDRSILDDHRRERFVAALAAPLASSAVRYPLALAGHAARSIALDLGIDRAPVEDALGQLLGRWSTLDVRSALALLSTLDISPGDPYLATRAPEDLLRFMADAARRVREAGEHGFGPALCLALPKTGSAFLSAFLCHVMNVPACSMAFRHTLRVIPWVRFAARYPVVLHEHLLPLGENVKAVSDAGISRLVLHVRDPRQVMVSLAHHITAHPDAADPALRDALHGDMSGAMDGLIDIWASKLANWVDRWVRAAGVSGIELRLTRFEDMAADPARFISGLLDFWGGAPSAAYDRLHCVLERMKTTREYGIPNFRLGHTDEWAGVLSSAQQRRLASKVEGPLAALYEL